MFAGTLRRVRGRGRYRPRRWLSRGWNAWQLMTSNGWIKVVGRSYYGLTAWSSVWGGIEYQTYASLTHYGELLAMKKRKQSEGKSDQQHVAAMESVVFSKLHPLIAHCAVTRYDDGDPRKPGWITLKTMGSAWVLEAKDPDTSSRLTVVQSSLDDALALLSALLESEEAPWELDPWLAQQAAKGKKK